jgi:hypothetical protein
MKGRNSYRKRTLMGSLAPSYVSTELGCMLCVLAGVFVAACRRLSRLVIRLSKPCPGVLVRCAVVGTASDPPAVLLTALCGGGVATLAWAVLAAAAAVLEAPHCGRVAVAVAALAVETRVLGAAAASGCGTGVIARLERVVLRGGGGLVVDVD